MFGSEAFRAISMSQSPMDNVGFLQSALLVGKWAVEHVGIVKPQRLCSVRTSSQHDEVVVKSLEEGRKNHSGLTHSLIPVSFPLLEECNQCQSFSLPGKSVRVKRIPQPLNVH